MATRTSAKSGNWSATDTWVGGVVPANADAFVIAAGHDVVFDVDQSAMATGMAASTITGTLRFDVTKSTLLKMNANLTVSYTGLLFVGNSFLDPVPRGVVATIQFSAAATMIVGDSSSGFFFGWTPEHSNTTVAVPALTGATAITFVDDMDLIAGEKIAIGATGAPVRLVPEDYNVWNSEKDHRMITGVKGLHTIQSYNAATKTATLVEPLEHDRAVGDLVGRFTRQIVIKRPTPFAAQATSMLNGGFYGVLFMNTRGPSSHQTRGTFWEYQEQFPGVECGVFHCTAYNSPGGGLNYDASEINIYDSVVYYDYWADTNEIPGIIQFRNSSAATAGTVERVVCINSHGMLFYNASGGAFTDITTQNTGGESYFDSLVTTVIRRLVNKSAHGNYAGVYIDSCVFVDCKLNGPNPPEMRGLNTSKSYSHDGVSGAIATYGGYGETVVTSEAGRTVGRVRISNTGGFTWTEYRVYFPAGVPMSFSIPAKPVSTQVQARLMVIDPAADPFAPFHLFAPTVQNDEWVDKEWDDPVPPSGPSTFDNPVPGCLAETKLPLDAPVGAWTPMTVTYTSPVDQFLIVRVWSNWYQTWDQFSGAFPWNTDEGGYGWFYGPKGVLIEFDLTDLESGIADIANGRKLSL